ncbi:MAG TPA: hypothetical protein QGI59_01315 [Candidatus Poseidoniia archaeon]|nr:hypothetical protein [Candidatus Poseidoniia archaeon]
MSSEDELWKSGKSDDNTAKETVDEENTLDLSSPSPEKGDDLNLSPLAISEDEEKTDENNWHKEIREPGREEGISIKTIGAIGSVTILLLTGLLYILLAQQNIEIIVPNEKYEEEIIYDINGSINFDSTLDIPLPIGFIDNDIVINELDITFSGKLQAGISGTVEMITDGYGNDRSVFEKYLIQDLEDIDGTITREGENPASLENAEILTSQSQFIDPTSLEIVKTYIDSNASYSDTLTGSTWYWQGATDWVPRESETGILPHGDSYIGKKLVEGSKGTVLEGGIEFNWKVFNGGKINGKQTVLLKISTSYVSDSILGYQYQYHYEFDFYLSEENSMPLKFWMKVNSDASSPSGKLYSINLEYTGKAIPDGIVGGYLEVQTTPTDYVKNEKTGEFSQWVNGAPAFGNGSCGLDSTFTLQSGIQAGEDEISGFNSYIRDQDSKNKPAFLTEANYTEKGNGKWNFTMAHYNEQVENIDAWILGYNRTAIAGEEITVDNPIMSMDDIPEPLTVCSAEEIMTEFKEIEDWTVNDKTKNVDYEKVKLIVGQNLVSKQSLSSPTSIINFGNLNLVNIVSDLSEGNLNPNDYSNNIDVDTAGSYAYFLEKKGIDNTPNENKYQKLAGVDAKDGLVLFNLESINSN